jgi:CheY-like chemotaxis protein
MTQSPTRVLVVDDDLSWRILLSLVLQQLGYEPIGVGSVDRALDRLEAGAADAVLTDLHMPVRSGIDLLIELGERRLRVPVLALTASGDQVLRRRAVELGAVDVLEKNADPDALGRALDVALARPDAA